MCFCIVLFSFVKFACLVCVQVHMCVQAGRCACVCVLINACKLCVWENMEVRGELFRNRFSPSLFWGKSLTCTRHCVHHRSAGITGERHFNHLLMWIPEIKPRLSGFGSNCFLLSESFVLPIFLFFNYTAIWILEPVPTWMLKNHSHRYIQNLKSEWRQPMTRER